MIEYKSLKDICSVHTGSQLNRDDMIEDGKYPVINGGRVPSGFTNTANEKGQCITISQGGESAGFVNWISTDFWAGAHCFVLDNYKVDRRFLYHLLKSKEEKIKETKQGAGIPGINKVNLLRFVVPVPSPPNQKVLVDKLDSFTDLISKLDEEIELRKKQFDYYRGFFFRNLGSSVSLREVAKIMNGKDYKSKDLGNIPVYGSGGVMTFIDSSLYNGPSVLLPRKGSVEKIYYVDSPFWTVDTIYWTIIDSKLIMPKFLYYALLNYNLKNYALEGGIPSLTQNILYRLQIPLTTLTTQQTIVERLDTFTSLISKLQEERDLRQKQYEYYREKLLTFE